MGLYGLYVVEQLLSNSASSATDEFRLLVLVGVLPLLLVFFTWGSLRWLRLRQQQPAG
jgi:hypothetical protein